MEEAEPQNQSTPDTRLQVSILPPPDLGGTLVMCSQECSVPVTEDYLRVGQRPHVTRFRTGLCLVLELGPRAVPGTGFSAVGLQKSWGLLFVEATEAANNSLTGF